MTPATLDIIILGSGTSTGIPVIGCDCQVCSSTDPRNRRTRCSALLRYGDRNILIDTSPDLRLQALRENIRQVDAVLYTHSHADHMHGIDDLRSFSLHAKKPIPVYGSPATLERVRNDFSYIFNENDQTGYIPRLELFPVEQPFKLYDLFITPIPLGHGPMRVLGYRCGPLAYLTDCNLIPASSFALLNDLELLILDGLRFKPHTTHFNIAQAVQTAQQIGARQTWLTHLTHDVDFACHEPQLPAGIHYAYDGLRLALPYRPDFSSRSGVE